MKTIIIYYSRSGATEALAQLIARLTGGELCRVQPAEPYSDDYRATVERAKAELSAGAAIGLAGRLPGVSGFDAVLAGTPNWCGLMAPPVSSALRRACRWRASCSRPSARTAAGASGASKRSWPRSVPARGCCRAISAGARTKRPCAPGWPG